MKVVNGLENENLNKETSENQSGFIRMKKFHFVMLLFFIVILAAGITTFALAFGDEKAVSVGTERSEFEKLYTAYDTLKANYFKDLEGEKLVNGAINGMLESLEDPYSDYMNVEEAEGFHESISSSFEGIGAEIQEREGSIVIVTPLKGSPAEKAGLKPNDTVLSVNGESLQGLSSAEAISLIRGEKGTKVKLQVQRAGVEDTMDISIVRDTIPIETVYGEMLGDEGIAKVQITAFSENTSEELIDELNGLQKKGMKGLILDLRQNPGGLLDQAIAISSLFVPEGKILFQIEDRNGNVEEVKSTGNDSLDVPLVVLIDNGSASASEILAAAVRESANVKLVGEKSFGKGTVQSAQDFTDGSNMKFTTQKWLTPNGNWIHENGIEPDFKVGLPKYASLPIINPESKLKLSSTSSEVKTAQQMLKAVGFDPGRQDGFFDEKTEQATKDFQEKQKINVTGIITGETTLALMEELREKINNNDTQVKKAIEVLKEKM